jgi:hypothetical protein
MPRCVRVRCETPCQLNALAPCREDFSVERLLTAHSTGDAIHSVKNTVRRSIMLDAD